MGSVIYRVCGMAGGVSYDAAEEALDTERAVSPTEMHMPAPQGTTGGAFILPQSCLRPSRFPEGPPARAG